MTPAADIGVAGFEIKVAGTALDPLVHEEVSEIIVDGRLRVPDRLTLRIRDDAQEVIDAGTFAIGGAITVAMGADDESGSALVFDGQITALAPQFDVTTATLTVLALDRGCLLQRAPATAAYQSMSYGDIARKLASAAGLSPGTIEAGLTLDFVQQSNETPWDFLWRLAADVDFEVKVTGKKLNFRPAGGPAGGTPVELTMGENLRSFSPRVTGVEQIDSVEVRGWDPISAKSMSATTSPQATQSKPGVKRDDVAKKLGSGSAIVVDQPLINQTHATAVAKSVAARIANAYIEGEGTADGTPALTAGAKVKLDGVGKTFNGTYAISGVRHAITSYSTFETRFFISGREDRSLFGLATRGAADPDGWAKRIVVGVVTNNDDPDKQGRVRVRYPALSDDHEGWWARVVATGAGGSRGLVSLPVPGDEVLIAFEHESDQHPYVLGAVFNGQALPGELQKTDKSFGLFSDKELIVKAVDRIAMTGQKSMTLTSADDAKLTTKGGGGMGNVEVSSVANLALASDQASTFEAQTSLGAKAGTAMTIEAGTTLDVKSNIAMTVAAGTTLELSGTGMVTIKAASIRLQADGVVQISAPQVMLG